VFIEDRYLQLVLTKLNDMVIDEPIQIKEHKPLLIENASSGFVEFELINNCLTCGSIIRTNVHVHYHNDVPIEFNYVPDYNDHNDTSNKVPIDVYTL